MRPKLTYRVTGIDEEGKRYTVGEGMSYSQAELICRRLMEWKMFAEVSLAPDLPERHSETWPSIGRTVSLQRRRLRRLLAALGLM